MTGMCGIAGFIDRTPDRTEEASKAVLKSMTDSLKHRGPMTGTIGSISNGELGLGFRRLSILDLSTEGRQPMFSPSEPMSLCSMERSTTTR